MSFRTYFQVEGPDRSGLAAQVAGQRSRVTDRMRTVDRLVAVMSGKGGVGKSYLAAALARGLSRRSGSGRAVGVLDADLQGPTVARALGAQGPLVVGPDGVAPAVGTDGVRVVSMDLLLDEGAPLRWTRGAGGTRPWRGLAEVGALRELLADVSWGSLALLLVDMPPDAEGLHDLAALVPEKLAAVAVTLPSDESRRSVARAIRVARDARVPLLGVVENMSGYACDDCRTVRRLFTGDAGARLAAEFEIPLLARLPFAPSARVPDLPPPLLDAVWPCPPPASPEAP